MIWIQKTKTRWNQGLTARQETKKSPPTPSKKNNFSKSSCF